MRKNTQIQQGFSLLEVLISIAIVAGIAVSLVPAISATARTASRIHSAANISEEFRTGGEVFRRLTSQMVNLSMDGSQASFSGARESMSFMSIDTLTGDTVKYSISASDDGNITVSTPTLSDDSPDEAIHSYAMIANLDNVGFDYFDAEEEVWLNSWDKKGKLPSLIRLRGTTIGATPTTITLENAPRATASFSCQFDPVSRICRVM